LDNYLRRNNKRGLRHVVNRLKSELLVLGLLSLLLVAFEVTALPPVPSCSSAQLLLSARSGGMLTAALPNACRATC
jgi:hypothetical protein